MIDNKTNQLPSSLDSNARLISFALLAAGVSGVGASLFVAFQTGLTLVYYYAAFFVLCAIIYFVGFEFIRRGNRITGIGIGQFSFTIGFLAIVLGFSEVGLPIAFIIGTVVWQISFLTLEKPHSTRATVVGLAFALFAIGIDLFWPFTRLRVAGAIWSTYIIGGGLTLAFIVLFLRNFRNVNIQTKLVVLTVGTAIFATVVELVLFSNSTRTILTNQTEVEIELRGQKVAGEVVTQIEKQVDRLRALSTNQVIESQITEDVSDLTGLETEIIALILERRNEVWVNNSDNFSLDRHFPFFQRLRNPVADLLRDYKENFPETEQLMVINQYGSVVAMSNRLDAPRYIYKDTEWWQQIIQNNQREPFIGDPISLPNNTLGIPICGGLCDPQVGRMAARLRPSGCGVLRLLPVAARIGARQRGP
ncbi:MAG: hypothetical protein AAGD96_14650, partial [Chloroflexota bacterium]